MLSPSYVNNRIRNGVLRNTEGIAGITISGSGFGGGLDVTSVLFDGVTVKNNKDMSIVMNECVIRAPEAVQPAVSCESQNCSVTVNQCTLFGAGAGGSNTQVMLSRTAGALIVNDSIVNGNVHEPQLIDSGSISYANTLFNQAVRFTGYDTAIFSICARDSEFARPPTGDGQHMADYLPMLLAKNVKMAYYPDDTYKWPFTAALQNNSQAWIAAGHEHGNAGYSADVKMRAAPFSISWNGPGIGTIEISNAGTLLELKVDELIVSSFDISRSFSSSNGVIGTLISGKLAENINNITDWSLTLTSQIFDDTLSYTLDDGIYGSGELIPFDEDRRWNEEVDISIHDLELSIGEGAIETMNSAAGGAPQSYKDYVENFGLKGLIGTDGTMLTYTKIEGLSDYYSLNSLALTATMNGSQAQIEATANNIITNSFFNGAYQILVLAVPGTLNSWTATQTGYLIDEIKSAGGEIKTVAEAIDFMKANA